VGVIDRLRSLSPFAAPTVDIPSGSFERERSAATVGEQRGDFMMLPPLRQTFGSLDRLQHPIGDFLVTHRPTTVSNGPLTHGVGDAPLGLITARARRRPNRSNSRALRDALVHRARVADEPDDEFEPQEPSALPPLPMPRRLAASAKPASAPPPVEQGANAAPTDPGPSVPNLAHPFLPSRSEVSRAVRGPDLSSPVAKRNLSPDIVVGNVLEPWSPTPFTAPEMPASTISNAPDSPPVLRRRVSRGRVHVPIEPDDPDDALVEQVLAERSSNSDESSDANSPDGPSAGEGWSGPTPLSNARVRGLAPPEPASAPAPPALQPRRGPDPVTEPEVDSISTLPPASTPPAESVSSPIEAGPGGSVGSTPLISAAGRRSMANASGISAEQRDSASLPAAESVSSPIEAGPGGSGGASPLISAAGRRSMANASGISADERGSAAAPLAEPSAHAGSTSAPAVAPSGRSTSSRPTLASREPLVSAGTTGVQRRARDETGGMRTATPTGLRATMPSSGSLPGAQAEPSSSGGSRSVAVPEHVRRAVRGSVGTAPSEVVVHEGSRAEALTRSVNAEAFTRDGEIFLAADVPLDSTRGQQLLAHELTHVVQQKGGAERMPAEHTAEGLDLEAGARHAEGLMQSMHEGPPQLHHRSSSVNAPGIPQMVAGEGVQRSARDAAPPAGSPTPIASAPALSRGGPQPVNFLDDNWRIEVGQRPDGVPMSSMSDSELALSSGPPPITKDEKSGRLRDLERQAHELYPLIRQRLRAELVRDKERRGRMSREWG
jgi:hypothetical protein